MAGLTKRQREIFAGATAYHEQHGAWPSRTKLAAHMGLEESGHMQRVLKMLRDRGHIPAVAKRPSAHALWCRGIRAQIKEAAAAQGIEVPEALLDIISATIDGGKH